MARLYLAESLRQDEQAEDAARKLGLSRKLLQKAPVPVPQNHSELKIKLAELKGIQHDKSLALRNWSQFIDQVSDTGDFYIISTALWDLVSAALGILQETPNEENIKLFWHWQLRAESLLEEVGDIYFLYLFHVTTTEVALELMQNHGAMLQWHEDFDNKYPDFKLWAIKIIGKIRKQRIYARLGDQSNLFRTIMEIEKLMIEMEAFWIEEGYNPLSSSNQDIMLHPELGQQNILTEGHDSGLVQSVWFHEWTKELPAGLGVTAENFVAVAGTSDIAPSQVTEQTLLRWLKHDASQVPLSHMLSEFFSIIGDEQANPVDVHDFLGQLTPETLSRRLYGPVSFPNPTAVWGRIFSTLSEWLLDHTAFHESKRHFLLLKLQELRVFKMNNSTSANVDRAIEGQRLLDLVPKLNTEVQSLTMETLPFWRNVVASLKALIYFETHRHGFLDEEVPEFVEILSLYQTSLEDFRGKG